MTTETTSLPLAERIELAIGEDKIQLPPLPELALRVKKMLEDDDRADASKVADVIRNDPAVTAALLRFANSAAFGGLRPISDLNQAIARLGLKQVEMLVTAMEVKGLFHAKCEEKKKLLQTIWDHSVACAMASKRLADRGDLDVEEAFLAGLLHDCGKLMVLKGIDHIEDEDKSLSITLPVMLELMETLHARLGHAVLESWRLPESICKAAQLHNDEVNGRTDPIVTIVQAANVISRKLGFHLEPDTDLELLGEPSLEELGLRDIELATLMVDLEDEMNAVRQMF